ncbi:hypothetical protein [Microvirga aerophila]|uniref:HEPN AbiU2-like domain-containing protein n=1 Tax=Microvirga aerophila TaxID=670291 RepID=A0A512BW97_9HYPH|nr:hypothetical protein [Microvirga aerophila]GEO16232.1 hypothetical protein MAE02_39280 [Microvirga aerophila]
MTPDKSERRVYEAFTDFPHAERMRLVREIALRSYKDAVDLSACRALIYTYPHSYFHDPLTARAARQVLISLIDRTLIISESALGLMKRTDDRNARVALFLLGDPAVYHDVARVGNPRSLELALQAWTATDLDPRRGLIKQYRNKSIAHRSDPDPGKREPFIDEIHTISGRVVSMLAHLATGAGAQVEATAVNSDTNYLSASAFWKPWQTITGA